jgi:hypothetical protein
VAAVDLLEVLGVERAGGAADASEYESATRADRMVFMASAESPPYRC